jgi:hypothetical protein
MASKRRDAPHLVAPIRRYATSKVSALRQQQEEHMSVLRICMFVCLVLGARIAAGDSHGCKHSMC